MSTVSAHTTYATGLERMLGHLAMVLFALCVAGSFSVGALVANDIAPAPLNAIRFFFATALMGVVAFVVQRHHLRVPAKPWRFLIYGVLNGTYFVTMFVALTMTAPVATSAVFTLSPLLTAILGFLILGQKARPIVIFSILLAAAGALWVIFRADISAILGFEIGPGEAIFLVGCVAYALISPLVRKLKQDEPGVVFTFWLLAGTALCIAIYGATGIVETPWLQLPGHVWWSIAYLTIFPTAVSFFLLHYASLRLPTSKVMAYVYLLPGLVILIEGLIGNGWASAAVMMGAGITVVALIVLAVAAD